MMDIELRDGAPARPSVSIVIPTKNRLRLLADALDSVQAQTIRDWECLVIDDGSTDGTEDELARRAAADARVRYIRRSSPRGGANVCRNIGLMQAAADLILFLDSDDLLRPECLQNRVDVMARDQSLDFAVFPGWVFTGQVADAGRLFARQVDGDDLDRLLYLDYPWEITSPIWRRRVLESLGGFDEALPSWQDIDLHVRALIARLHYRKNDRPDHYIRWKAEPTKTSVRQFTEPEHLHSGQELVLAFRSRLAEARMLTPVRTLALAGLLFLLAERWTRLGHVSQARATWLHARKSGLIGSSCYWCGVLVLLAFKLGMLRPDYNDRLLERFKIAAGFRYQPLGAWPTFMNRITISQALLDARSRPTYLEIGIDTGSSFIPIRASLKWGVDPTYTLSRKRRGKYALFSLLRLRVERLFRMRSDNFFAAYGAVLQRHGIDVCFVDGLHTYEQSLRDVLNALRYLKPGGVIVVHDCNPSTALMACPADSIHEMIRKGIPGWDGAWSGDVWKTIVHLRSLRPDLNAFVLDCDTGVGVVSRRAAQAALPYSEADIRQMDYSALDANRTRLLDLRPATAFRVFLEQHRRESAQS